MKIIKVSEVYNGNKGRIEVTVESHQNVHVNDILYIHYDWRKDYIKDNNAYFKVESVETGSDDSLIISARNFGYTNILRNIDIRTFLEEEVFLLEDDLKKKELERESHYI